jgi:hypothetical protein
MRREILYGVKAFIIKPFRLSSKIGLEGPSREKAAVLLKETFSKTANAQGFERGQ